MRRANAVTAAAFALALSLLSAAPSGAAEPVGSATLLVSQGKWQALEQRGVSFTAGDSTGRQARLQVRGGMIGNETADLAYKGSLKLSVGEGRARRTVKLTALRVALDQRSTLSAKLGKKRRTIFDLAAAPGTLTVDPIKGVAQLHNARLLWRKGVLETLDKRLGVSLPRGSFGTLRVSAAVVVDVEKLEAPAGEPPLLARPASAVNVTSATLTWHVRDSWIRYINTQEAPQATEGASAEPPIQENSHPCPNRPAGTNPTLVYSYSFPFSNGWYDAATNTAGLYYSGSLRFNFPERGIDITARNPEIEINGASSRSIFRISTGEAYKDKRAPFLNLEPSSPNQSPPGSFSFPSPIRGSLTDEGQNIFGGFYPPPNNGFGCFSVAFSTG